MKKLVFALAVVFSMSFIACSNKEAANNEANAECCDSLNCTEKVEATLEATEVVDPATNTETVVEENTEVTEAAPEAAPETK